MPYAAEVHLLMLELLHLDNLGEARQSFHERILDRPADPAGEGHVLLAGQVLVAEENYLAFQPEAANLGDFPVRRLGERDAGDLGAERSRNALHLHAASGTSSITVVRRMSRGYLVSSYGVPRCMVWRLSHTTRS